MRTIYLCLIACAVPAAAQAQTEALFRHGAKVHVEGHAEVPITIALPEAIHKVRALAPGYNIERYDNHIVVYPPPLVPDKRILITTVSDVQVSVFITKAKSMFTAESRVDFVRDKATTRAPELAIEADTPTEEPVNTRQHKEPASEPARDGRKRVWSLDIAPMVGRVKVKDKGYSTPSTMSGLATCITTDLQKKFSAHGCGDHAWLHKPTGSRSTCRMASDQPPGCTAEIWRRQNIGRVYFGLVVQHGNLWSAFGEANVGTVIAYSNDQQIREFGVADKTIPVFMTQHRAMQVNMLPFGSLGVGIARKLNRVHIYIALRSSIAAPISGLSAFTNETSLGVRYAL